MPKRKPITAGELNDRQNADPVWVAAQRERDRHWAELKAFYLANQAPLVKDLNDAGIAVKSVWDLVNTSAKYPAAIPILLDHLNQNYHPRIREGIARSLAVREANGGWAILLKAFHDETDMRSELKWALSLALSGAATDREMDDLIPLYRDESLGDTRMALMLFLKRSRDPRADQILEELVKDPALAYEGSKIQRHRQRRKK